jgi:hypothetical protein
VLILSVDFSGPEAQVSIQVSHYGILEGLQLTQYLVTQSLVLFNILIMLVDVAHAVSREVRSSKYDVTKLIEPFVDFMCAALVIIYVILMFRSVPGSASSAAKVLQGLEGIPWSNPDVRLQDKAQEFFKTMRDLMALISTEDTNNVICNVILLVNLLRVIQCTSLHPRLALLTGTVANAADDLWHTALLTCLLMLCFAGIGTWRFGNTMEEFGSFEQALQTEFQMLFGEFIDKWATDPQLPRELQAFVVLYLMVLFLLVLNFLLAIIVEAYMKVRQENTRLRIESEFFHDCWGAVSGAAQGIKCRWPSSAVLGNELVGWKAKLSVGVPELSKTGIAQHLCVRALAVQCHILTTCPCLHI